MAYLDTTAYNSSQTSRSSNVSERDGLGEPSYHKSFKVILQLIGIGVLFTVVLWLLGRGWSIGTVEYFASATKYYHPIEQFTKSIYPSAGLHFMNLVYTIVLPFTIIWWLSGIYFLKGYLETRCLREILPALRHWTLLTVIGSLLAVWIPSIATVLLVASMPPPSLRYILPLVSGAAGTLCVSGMQAFALRRLVPHSWLWALTGTLATSTVFVVWLCLGLTSSTPPWSGILVLLSSVLDVGIGTLSMGVVLVRLLYRRPTIISHMQEQ